VLTIVDVFDALTTERPYKRALTIGEAFSVMEEEVAKQWWDPELFEVFRSTFQEEEIAAAPSGNLCQKATYTG
jgi:putative two-component system response regulator